VLLKYYFLERVHIKIKRTSFEQILPTTALKFLDIRQYACGLSSCIRSNYARKSAHLFYVDTL